MPTTPYIRQFYVYNLHRFCANFDFRNAKFDPQNQIRALIVEEITDLSTS